MAVFINVELESITSLPEIMNCLIEKSIKFTVSKDRQSLCDRCSLIKEEPCQISASSSINPFVATSTPSSGSFEQMEAYPRSESVDSEANENVKSEICTPHMCDSTPPIRDELDDTDIVACGSELLQQVSANFSSYQETKFVDSDASVVREKGSGSAPKQCQTKVHSVWTGFRSNEPCLDSHRKVPLWGSESESGIGHVSWTPSCHLFFLLRNKLWLILAQNYRQNYRTVDTSVTNFVVFAVIFVFLVLIFQFL
ncbi:unnamed protein product [Nippostrongylus brasiliensis]|uniref:Ovule protein n=1 Tax=Nippostrongylus brasiliensis TaxID=27835 RepID=A0A0N4YLW2_NIPBR|nr:unnamed protein product [Nippostrongylus brasiliensis]